MKHRYSIMGLQHGADHESELAQCDTNPDAIKDGYIKMTLTVMPSINGPRKKTKVRKYAWVRIIDHGGS
jgi:hypothetical protein